MEPSYILRPMWACRSPKIMECHMEKVLNYRGNWLPSEKNQNIQAEITEVALHEPFRMQ